MKWIFSFLAETGRVVGFTRQLIETLLSQEVSRREIYQQIWQVTRESLPTTLVSGFFVGAIMSVQFTLQVKQFGALGYLGGLATSATVREVGPLLIAFLLAGKIGAFTSAELGTMRVTEQLDAIRCLGADPLAEIVVPRFVGIIVAFFFLIILALVSSTFGGALIGQLVAGISAQEYFRNIPHIVHWVSLVSGLLKCLVFAFLIASLCTFYGYTATGGAKGVGLSVVRTAVTTMICIVVADWITSDLMTVTLKLGGIL